MANKVAGASMKKCLSVFRQFIRGDWGGKDHAAIVKSRMPATLQALPPTTQDEIAQFTLDEVEHQRSGIIKRVGPYVDRARQLEGM